ncbi:hypothetical protein, partial [Roseivivax halodurans]|uniref:hypothetical protein n=1 Tax=Roseivivax halodurans TaxID=93683 RepID=UPI0005668197
DFFSSLLIVNIRLKAYDLEQGNLPRQSLSPRSASQPFWHRAEDGGFEPVAEEENSRCVRLQRHFYCGAANLHAASQLWIRSHEVGAAKPSGAATAAREFLPFDARARFTMQMRTHPGGRA